MINNNNMSSTIQLSHDRDYRMLLKNSSTKDEKTSFLVKDKE